MMVLATPVIFHMVSTMAMVMAMVTLRGDHVRMTRAMTVMMTMMIPRATAISTATTRGLIVVVVASHRNHRMTLASFS